MMKLLKYDLKRNANTFLGMAAILVIVQAALSIVGNVKGWDDGLIIAFNIILYVSAGIIMLVLVCKTFEANIKAYNRRLLPVHPAWTVLSSLLLGLIMAAVFVAVAFIHALLYLHFKGIPYDLSFGLASVKDWLEITLAAAWGYSVLVLTVFTAITIGASVSIRGKAGTWIGIVSFFVIINVMSWLESLLFGNGDSSVLSLGVFRGSTNDTLTMATGSIQFLSIAEFLFEAAFVGLMFYATIYLLSKRMEI
ncbi:hypothetical protein NYE69_08860 [Paenibacillus sp. FSL R5-0527]|uniref:hypothetical protein n=1 Tax=Paenibacillus sp. FSL R5-0527 TaxID=2975321 RepID=UPI00097B470C|nr:hypothetical protein BK140_26950 [Paenibacillus macerans]